MVKLLIDVVFHEMSLASKHLHTRVSKQKKQAKELEVTAGVRLVEHAKKFLHQYLVHCRANKFNVLRYLVCAVNFDGKRMRQSFIEEILEGTNQLFLSQIYLRKILQAEQPFGGLGERILITSPLLVHIGVKDPYELRSKSMGKKYHSLRVIFTNVGVYLVDDSEDSE